MGGFVMPRKYRHIKDYEKELIEYIEQGHALRETGEESILNTILNTKK